MKRTLFILLLIFTGISLLAQSTYIIVNDSVSIVGVNVLNASSTGMAIKENKTIQIYAPDDILSFYDGNSLYETREVLIDGQKKSFFLEVLTRDNNITLYYLRYHQKKYFFKEDEKGFTQMVDGDDYYNYLNEISPNEINFSGRRGLSRYHLKNDYKIAKDGNINMLRSFRWGVFMMGGTGMISGNHLIPSGESDWYFTGGFFAELPLRYGWSLVPRLFYLKDAFSGHAKDKESGYYEDFIINRGSLVLPVVVRYTFIKSAKPFLWYLEAGPNINYSLQSKGEYRIIKKEELVTVLQHKEYTGNKTNFGVIAGLGLAIKLIGKHKLDLGFNYIYSGTGIDSQKLNYLIFNTGINF